MKKAVLVFTIIVVALIAWVVAFPNNNPLKKLFVKKATATPGDTSQPGNTAPVQNGSFISTPPTPQDINGFPLSQGSRGEYVKKLQAALNNRFGTDLVVDGIFGPKTYKAVSSNGFNADSVTYSEYIEILGLK